jgi:hypothetical protein
MIEFYVGNTGIRFQNIEDIKYIIDNSLEEEILDLFCSLLEMQMISFLEIGNDDGKKDKKNDDSNLGFNLGD